ncbi:MAG: hypothetical protein LBV45_04310 [Xanthomonadaceae bacterium]|jgi:iron complex outermembrane receptor protein/hemoglobin/transferrin/lactoferrin receptor protein|nr:hypothetical protein [Xanthomonadaceae bacterium]
MHIGFSLHPLPAKDFQISALIKHWFKPGKNPASYTSCGVTYYYVRGAYTHVNLNARWRPNNTEIGFLDDTTQFLFGIENLPDKR